MNKRRRPSSPASQRDTAVKPDSDSVNTTSSSDGLSTRASKKLKQLADHSNCSPFSDFLHPSTEDVRAVYALLASHTPGGAPVHDAPPANSNSAMTCGYTPNVIDALIGTILSQNTSSANSSAAKRELDSVFGQGEPGFEKMADADRDTIADTIRSGGLANRKAKIIQEALAAVKKKHGRYDLQHLAAPGVTDERAMQELVSFDGVGPKTAACVLSFCLRRQAFAVDTHVFRLSKLLGWVPKTASRIGTQAHLELRIPPELKYGLHVMMVLHGRACRGCKKDGRGPCPLKSWLKERTTTHPDSEGRVKEDSSLGDPEAL
ncbi:DNA glycosylase [Boletus coccyginus]|nr:DNA glycosylase [Boletus coccyginus]